MSKKPSSPKMQNDATVHGNQQNLDGANQKLFFQNIKRIVNTNKVIAVHLNKY